MKRIYLILVALLLCVLFCTVFSSCGNTEGGGTENSEHTHIFSAWTTTREATCSQEGERKQSCTCGELKTEAIPTIAHTLVEVEGRAPTCEKGGRTSGKKCSMCDTIIIAQHVIGPTGHSARTLSEKAPTCQKTGLTEGTACANCDMVMVEQEIIPIVSCNVVDGFCTMCKVSYASDGLIFEASEDNTYAILTDVGMCTDSVVYIPATYENLPVKEIGKEAFAYTGSVTEVHLPSTVEVIGESAFISCQGLEKVYLTSGLKETGYLAFKNCPKLKDVYYSGKVEEWCVINFGGNMPLCNKANLYIGGELLTNLVITNDFTEIKQFAFADCISVTSITVEKVEKFPYISSSAFLNNDSVGKLYIKDLESWCGYDFQGYVQNPMSIVKKVYINGEPLSKLEIPNTVTEIKDYAFYNCTQLESVTIPNSVTSIGNSSFYKCKGLTSIEIPKSITTICDSAFYGCTGLASVEIPSNVTTICDSAFRGCTGLTSIEIPSSVTTIGFSAFYGCTGLEKITIPFVGNGSDQTHFGYIFGASSYSENKSYIPAKLKNVVITGDEAIDDYAFRSCKVLTTVEIQNSVTSIGNSAFEYCTSLTSIEIPNSVTSIGGMAFEYCTSLTSIEIPNSVTSIGGWAFAYCTSLTNILIPNSVISIGRKVFYNSSSLKIYCEAATKPNGWDSYWDDKTDDVRFSVIWGYAQN